MTDTQTLSYYYMLDMNHNNKRQKFIDLAKSPSNSACIASLQR